MHVGLLTNRAWLDEELTPFQHLVVGLIDERMRVAQVVPEGISEDDLSAFGDQVGWRESRWPILNNRRVAQLADELTGLGVNLLHAVDGRLWRGGLKLAGLMDVPIILSANAWMDVRLAQQLLPGLDPTRVAVTAATEPISRAIRQHLPEEMLLSLIQTCVHSHAPRAYQVDPEQAICVVVSGNGEMDPDYTTLLQGVAEFARQHPASQFFFDGQGSGQHQIWKTASSMGLLSNISLTPRRLGHRELLLRAHALIHPQALGRARSLTLRAMARGLPVIAREDPVLDYLHHGQTAVVLDDPSAEDWARQLGWLIDRADEASALGLSANQWVKQHRSSSVQIGAFLDVYRRITGETLAFNA